MPKLIKILWSYWEGPGNILNKRCLNSWKRFLPDWDIRMLNNNTLEKYDILKPSTYNQLTITTKSDIIRLNLLYKYGGVWLDASILLHQNFDWIEKYIHLYSKNDYFQYKIPWENREENNFIVVLAENNYSIGKWLEILLEILEFWPDVQKSPIYKENYIHRPTYFMAYQVFIYLKKYDSKFKVGKRLPVNGAFAIAPVILPEFLERRYFTKFINGGRKIVKYQNCIVSLILIIILIYFILKVFNFRLKRL